VGKTRAKTGRNTQTISTSDHKGGKLVKLLQFSDFKIHLTRPNGTYFKSNYGLWTPLVMYKGN
jgi:hypothetical protein